MSKRRNHDAGFKARIALEAVKGERTVSELASTIRAVRRFTQGAPSNSGLEASGKPSAVQCVRIR